MKKILTIVFLALAISSQAQNKADVPSYTFGLAENDAKAVKEIRFKMAQIRKTRPTVALVLSGGGAKGAATVGVLKYLEQYDIPIDMVVGTSIGGLVGAMYSLGYDADYLENLFKTMDWGMALSDRVDRKYVPYSRIRYKEKYLISFPFYYGPDDYQNYLAGVAPFADTRSRQLKLGADDNSDKLNDIARGSILGSLPSGFVFGQNVNQVITSRTVGYSDSTNFFKMPIPFACVSTDMASGRAKVWHDGSINLAMRSTMSIPGLFAPVRTEGMVLVDGGMRNNFPVNIARQMGADIIIGIDLADASLKAEEIQNLGDILISSMDLFDDSFESNTKNADVHIHPNLTGYNMLSFNAQAVDTMYRRGYEAAEAMSKQLDAVKRRLGDAHFERKAPPAVDINAQEVMIGEVEIVGVSQKDADYIRSKMTVKPGSVVGASAISDEIARIFGKGSYDYVNYELRGTEEPYKLRILCKRGPMHQIGLGGRIDTDEVVSILLNVGLNTNAMQGSSLDLNARISSSPYVDLLYSYNAPRFSTVNVRAKVRYTEKTGSYIGLQNKPHYLFQAIQEVFFSNMKWSALDINLGIRNQWMQLKRSEIVDGAETTVTEKKDYPSAFIDGRVETLNDGYFPTKGVSAGIRGDLISSVFADPENRGKLHLVVSADGLVPVNFGRLCFIPQGAFRYVLGTDVPYIYGNVLGGDFKGRYMEQQIPFVGINEILMVPAGLAMTRLDARVRILKNHYVTATANVAYCFDTFKDFSSGQSIWGAGLTYGYDSIVGPLKVQVNWSSVTKKVGFMMSFGYNF